MAFKQITKYTSEDFGQYIKWKRVSQGETLRNMAMKLGITPAYLSDMEKSCRHAPVANAELMRKMIEVLSITNREEFCLMAIATRGWDFSYLNE